MATNKQGMRSIRLISCSKWIKVRFSWSVTHSDTVRYRNLTILSRDWKLLRVDIIRRAFSFRVLHLIALFRISCEFLLFWRTRACQSFLHFNLRCLRTCFLLIGPSDLFKPNHRPNATHKRLLLDFSMNGPFSWFDLLVDSGQSLI